MRRIHKQCIAYLLLLCLSVTLLPLNALHQHEENTHDCEISAEVENNLCHISIYHNWSQEDQCEHEHHFVESSEDCEFCKYITSRKTPFIARNAEFSVLDQVFLTSENEQKSFVLFENKSAIHGRAPPTV